MRSSSCAKNGCVVLLFVLLCSWALFIRWNRNRRTWLELRSYTGHSEVAPTTAPDPPLQLEAARGWKVALDKVKNEVRLELRDEFKQELQETYRAEAQKQSGGADNYFESNANTAAIADHDWTASCRAAENVDRKGHDLYDWAVKAASPSECCAVCTADGRCKAWVWQRENTACKLASGCAGCWLKDVVNPPTPNQGQTISGVSSRPVEGRARHAQVQEGGGDVHDERGANGRLLQLQSFESHANQDCVGNDIRMHKACRLSRADCIRELEDACRAEPGCAAFNIPGGWLKTSCTPTYVLHLFISGNPSCACVLACMHWNWLSAAVQLQIATPPPHILSYTYPPLY